MRYSFLSSFLTLLFIQLGFAQDSFTIKGTILDAQSLQPIVGANIIGNQYVTTSSKTGEFAIADVVKDSIVLTITHIAYSPKKVTVLRKQSSENLLIYLTQVTTTLEEVKVSGKSRRRIVNETPMVVQSVSKEFLDKNRENSLMQTLRKIPGVNTITIGSGQSKPVIRGLGFNRIVVVQNGIKHQAQQWGNDHGLEIDQYGIEDIRIVKGPASLVYGSDAIAGVVDIQPNRIPYINSFEGEVNLVGESNNDLLGVTAGVQARKDKWFYRGRMTYRDYADYKVPTRTINYENYIFNLHENNLRNTAGKEANASFSVGYVTEKLTSETFISNVNAKNGFFANAHGLEVRTSSIDYDQSNRDIDLPYHQVNHVKLTNNTTVNLGQHTLHVDLGYQNNHREEHAEPVPHGYMPKPPDSKERVFSKNTYAVNIKDVFSLNPQQDIVAGLNAEYQDNNIGGWGFLIPAYNRFSIGAFAYDQIELHSNMHLLAGVRYDFGLINTASYSDWYPSFVDNNDGSTSNVYVQRAQNKTLDFGNISASLGLSYIHKNTTYKINLGKSFRMPLANELASDGVNYHMYRYEQGNLDLDPEESYQLDLDIDHTTANFSIGVSPFVNFFENYIYLNPTSSYYETLQIYEYTQAKVFRIGGEIRAKSTIGNKLHVEASAEYVFSRQTTGPKKDFTIPFSPPLSALFSVNYQFKDALFLRNPQLIADFRMTATQNEIVPPEQRTEGYQVVNMSFLTGLNLFKNDTPVQLRVKLNNVFNTTYFDHTSFYRLIDVPEAGRNISISITVPFTN